MAERTLKILQLNIWTGRMKGPIETFFKKNQFDIICLQEAVWCDNEILKNFVIPVDRIKEISGLKYDYRSANWHIDAFNAKVYQGNVILSRDEIVESRTEFVWGKNDTLSSLDDIKNQKYNLQIVKLKNGLFVANHHGYWLPDPIGDENTIESMKNVATHIRKLDGPLIMTGDLNIIHKSPAMRELNFLKDLTHEYNIKNTLMGLKFDGEVACDHILVNDKITINNFEVLESLISDHKALIANIEF